MSDSTRRAALALTAALCLGVSSAGAQPAASALDGVWKVTNVVVTGAGALTNASPHANLYIFARGHYTNVGDTSRTPRTAAAAFKDPANPTEAEKLSKYDEWAPLNAQGGTYEVKGSTLVRHPLVAKNVGALTPPDQPSEFTLTGNTLVIVSKALPGQPAREQRLTLTRVR